MRIFFILFLFCFVCTTIVPAQPLTLPEIMKFKAIEDPILTRDGSRLAFTQVPDRGNPEVVVHDISSNNQFIYNLADNPAFSSDGNWLAARSVPSLKQQEDSEDKDKLKNGLILVNLETQEIETMDRVRSFLFSEEGNYLAIHFEKEEEESDDEESKKEASSWEQGAPFTLIMLDDGTRIEQERVNGFSFAPDGSFIILSATSDEGQEGILMEMQLPSQETRVLEQHEKGVFKNFVWHEEQNRVAYVAALAGEDGEPTGGRLMHLDNGGETEALVSSESLEEGWEIPIKNELVWSEDGSRLFVGLKPSKPAPEEKETESTNPYSIEALLEKKELDVWHWNDPLINSNQKKRWEDEESRTYLALYHFDNSVLVPLGDKNVKDVEPAKTGLHFLGKSDTPYLKEVTWGERYEDLYAIDGVNGDKKLVARKVTNDAATLSPGGRYIAFYSEGDWHLYDVASEATRNLTAEIAVPFANEDFDYPQDIPGYGSAGWLEDDSAILIYDKYDIWMFPTTEQEPFRLTDGEGRKEKRIYRVVRTDPEKNTFEPGASLLLSSYHDLKKNDGFYQAKVGEKGVTQLLESNHLYNFHVKAEDADVMVISREAYDEFPDLWVTNSKLESPEKISNVNPIVSERSWGTSELVEWNSVDGIPLQGVVIKPGNYDPSKTYPVIVYFYRFMSQRLNAFNQLHINHRPAFEWYASNDYILFLPDVRFEIGRPGFSAMKCIVPGVQKLIDMGIADPDAIGLHGHSWSGYQTAHIVTQTDFFTAAVAGAPVSNMTSAYGGIRWGSGLARQFQYERSQSRLGGSLWEVRDRYIDNSPLFFADRINTPLLIQHGDDDGAVPWYQSIELYLALRRLDKPGFFLQYRGEDHHLAKYPNKLDYAIKMKEFFDHYLKGEPAPVWMTEGIPYAGK